jgi:ABC-type transport system involved in cytochrome bd biosynthesis fused ATPase/permease subunit
MDAQQRLGGATRADWERLQASQSRNLRHAYLYTIPIGLLSIAISLVMAVIGRFGGVASMEYAAALLAALGVVITFRAIRLANRIRGELRKINAMLARFEDSEHLNLE